MIEVRINLSDMPSPLNMDNWATAIFEKLSAAGIPAYLGAGCDGLLRHWYDPNDFGVSIYQWVPMNEARLPADRNVKL